MNRYKPLKITLPDQYHWSEEHNNSNGISFRGKYWGQEDSPFHVIYISLTILPPAILNHTGDSIIETVSYLLPDTGVRLEKHQANDHYEDWFYSFRNAPQHPQLFAFYRKRETCVYCAKIEIARRELYVVTVEDWINIFFNSR
ncbi:hypothetical protein [Chitinophaga sp. OAE865]|uniref:hypothetical protein n=1 Tax=Chitinophaga sp. OAE865 TaxID=2817898 RepID=UPI001AE80722